MSILSGVSEFFGLDIGTSAVRAVQLKGSGTNKSLDRYGEVEIAGTAGLGDAKADQQKDIQTVLEAIKKAGISTKNVASNLPSHRVFTTVIDMDKMSPQDLAKTIHYQAESFIPTPPAQTKIDWAVIGDSASNAKKVEV